MRIPLAVLHLLALATGLWRTLGSYEKSNSYYWDNHVFLAKMGFFMAIVAMKIWPAMTLVMWRRASAKGQVDPAELAASGRRIARISDIQLVLLVATVTAAVMMARGYGA